MSTYPESTMRQTQYMWWRDVSIVVISIGLWVLPALGQTRSRDPNLLTESQKIEVGEGIRALRKMVSITKAGVNMQEYSSRVLDMVATVDESVRNIPDSRLKQSILAAKDAYVGARNNWSPASSIPPTLQRNFLKIAWDSAEIFVKDADDLFQAGRLNRETNER
jgi:hypothetical protein